MFQPCLLYMPCSPDFHMESFAKDVGPRLRALCPIITLYGDMADKVS